MTDRTGFYRMVFLVGAAYDMILGAVFFLAWRPIFDTLGIPHPETTAFLKIAAAYIFGQGLSYWYVSRNIIRNVDMVRVGIVYKFIYVGLAAYYLAIGQMPHMVFTLFAVCDLVFLVLFVACLRWEAASSTEARPASA